VTDPDNKPAQKKAKPPGMDEDESRDPLESSKPAPARRPMQQVQIDPDRPSLAGLDEWIRKNTILAMGLVVATAFVAKSIAPFHSFTIGLILGVAAVVGLYFLSFYRGRGKT
jgi:Flp pilus assembly protein TadB